MQRTHRPSIVIAALAASAALALSACGSGGSADVGSGNELATLEGDASAGTTAPSVPEMSSDEAALALSQCLRDEGLDVADIGLDADGNIDLRGALGELGPGDESFRTAMDSCRDILDGIGFGGGRGAGALADNSQIQDAFLAFSECIRSNGFEDIPDLTFGEGRPGADGTAGDGPPADGSVPDGAGRGAPQGGFGDRSSGFAERLGLDPEDPTVIAALDTCTPIIDQAFTDAGVGQPGQAPGA